MPSICGVCSVKCVEDDSVRCAGTCERSFHLKCIKDTDVKKTRSAPAWKCKDCRQHSSNQGSDKSSTSSTTITKEFFLKVLDNFKRDICEEIRLVKESNAELTASVQFLSEKADTANAIMKEVQDELKKIKKENEALKQENVNLKNEVGGLQERMRSLEQYTRRCNLELSGIPVTANESPVSIVKDVGKVLGIEVQEEDISAAHRIPSFKKERVPSMVIQFREKRLRDSLIESFKQRRREKDLTAREVNSAFPNSKIYVNEHLSPENKLFLSKLKKKCHESGYSFAWCREGKFFAKRANGDNTIKINGLCDFAKIK